MRLWCAALLFSSSILAPRLAWPCSGCASTAFWPGVEVVPAGLQRLAFAFGSPRGISSFGNSGQIVLVFGSDGQDIESVTRVDAVDPDVVWLDLASPLLPFVTYRIETVPPDGCSPAEVKTIRADAVTPLPTALGRLRVGPLTAGTSGTPASGSCSDRFPVVGAVVTLDVDAALGPWTNVLWLETMVNGLPRGPRQESLIEDAVLGTGSDGSWGSDWIYIDCSPRADGTRPTRQSPTRYRVRFVATLPGTDLHLETDEVEVELHCDSNDGGPGSDAEARPTLEEAELDGCGCAIGSPFGRKSGGGQPILLLLLSLAMLRRPRLPLLF